MWDILLKKMKEYTELSYLKAYNRNQIYKNKEFYVKLKTEEENISFILNEVADFNKPYQKFNSYADALLINSFITKDIPNEFYVHKNKFFEKILKDREINLIKCISLQNSTIGDSLLSDIKDEFLHRELKSETEIKEYIYYFLRTGSPHERIEHLDLIRNKLGVDCCSKIELDGEYLAKCNFNLFAQSVTVNEYKKLLFDLFKNENTIKSYKKYYQTLEEAIPF